MIRTSVLLLAIFGALLSLEPGAAQTLPQDSFPGAGGASDAESVRNQRDLKEILDMIQKRMEDLSEKLKESQPEDARRLDEAVTKIRTARVSEDLNEILESLRREHFWAALNRQDDVLKDLEEVIRILQASRFGEAAELDRKFEEAASLRRSLSRIRRGEENILKKTKDFREQESDAQSLKELGEKVGKLATSQEALQKGQNPTSGDSGESDERELERARELVGKLLEDQNQLNRLLEKVDARQGAQAAGDSPKGTESREGLSGLISELEKLNRETRSASETGERSQLGTQAKGLADRLSNLARSLSAGDSRADAAEKVRSAASSVGQSGEDIQKGNFPQALEAQEKALEDLRGAERELTGKGDPPGSPQHPDGLNPASQKAAQRQAEIAEASKDAAQELRSGASRVGSPRAQAGLKSGAGSIEEAQRAMEDVLEALQGGRESQKKGEGGQESQGGQEGQEGQEGQGGQEGQKGQEGAAKDAGGKSSPGDSSQKKSAPSPQEKASSQNKSASEAGREAARRLAQALESLSGSAKALAARTNEEKAADLQRKIEKKTEDAVREAERLQRKLRRKQDSPLARAREQLSQAARFMGQSAEARSAGNRAEAQEKGEEALERLRRAQKEMAQEEKDQLARMERRRLKDLAREQERLKEQARRLAKEMSSSRSTAQGAKGVEGAAGDMEAAEEDLDRENAESAQQNEEEALKKLQGAEEDALREEDRLARLKQERDLLNVVRELEEVKTEQEKINESIAELDLRRGDSRRPSRAIILSLRKQVDVETKIAERVDQLTKKVEEEIARVFAYVLRNIRSDMYQLVDFLELFETGKSTQFLGNEIVKELDRLLEALRNIRPPPPPEGGGGRNMPRPGRRRLVSGITELLLLKDLQEQVNRRTLQLELQRAASKSRAWERALNRLVQRQGSLTDMTMKIAEDIEKSQAGEQDEDLLDGGEAGGGEKNPGGGGDGK